jgi:hypothetical protein
MIVAADSPDIAVCLFFQNGAGCRVNPVRRPFRRAVNENIPVAKLTKSFGTLCDRA